MTEISSDTFKKYIKHGFSVFPVMLSLENGKYQKKPLVEWKDYQTRFATDEEIEVWVNMLDFNALGLCTGELSGIAVLDIDEPGTDYGFDSTVKVQTISGGLHLWFKWRPGIKNTVRINDKLMDVRGDGGFVVVPPAKCGDKKYQWISSDFTGLTDFPILPSFEEKYKPIMSELPFATEGNRNQTAIQVAGHMIAQTKRKSWETTAWPAFKNWNVEYVQPPLSEKELRITFESCCRMDSTKHPEEKENIRVFYGEELDLVHTRRVKEWGTGLTTGFDLLDGFFTLMPEHLYLISSPTHQGKTTLALNLGSRIAAYGERVLFCSLEQGVFITPRIKTILNGPVPDLFGLLESNSLVSTQDLIDTVNSLANRPRVIIVDHLHFMKKDFKNGVVSAIDQMIIDLQNACKTMQLPMIVITHLRKLNGKQAPDLDDLRDSSSLSQVPSVVVQLHREVDKDTTIMKEMGKMYIRKNRITGKMGILNYHLKNTGEIIFYSYSKEEERLGL